MSNALHRTGRTLTAPGCYDALMAGRATGVDEFDAHVLACVLAIGADEAERHVWTLNQAVGLAPAELAELLHWAFPRSIGVFGVIAGAPVVRSPDETCLVDLLRQAATSGAMAVGWLAPMIARRAQRPDHLWQDLGLRARSELSELMARHFHVLASRNTRNMKWKKYLYRVICGEAGYALCTAPSCAECVDFDMCFGEESGESFLARSRREADRLA
jgi:nitrogen fixation protein NifQ